MHRLLKLILPALLLPFLAPCAFGAGQAQAPLVPIDSIAAIVNDGVITVSQLKRRTEQVKAELQARGTPLPSESVLEHQVLNNMILDKIQLSLAALNGMHIDDQTFNNAVSQIAQNNNLTVDQLRKRVIAEGHSWQNFAQQLRNQLTIQQLQRRTVDQKVKITNQEVRDFLAQHANQIDPGLQYHLAQILIPIPGAVSPKQIQTALNEAEKLRRQALKGEDFAKLAVAHSAGQHALNGGDLGWLTADQLPTYFVRAINVMKPGDISQPIRTPSGFHLVKLLGERGGKQSTVIQTHVRHILIKVTPNMSNAQAKAKLERLRQEIEQGASFATLAKANSDDTASAVNGGDLGWVDPGELVPQFQKVMNNTPVGQISQPFRSPFGWHILQVLGRRKHDSTEQMVRIRAKEILFQRKRQEALNVWLQKIRDEAYVHILLKADKAQGTTPSAG